MSHTFPACSLQSRGHVLNFIQLRLAVGRWRREGVFTPGEILQVEADGFQLGTADGVVRLHHHWPRAIEDAVRRHGSDAVLLDHGVLVLLGAQQGLVYSAGSTFSVAEPDHVVACRTDVRPGDSHGPVVA